MIYLFLLGRLIVGAYYIHSGWKHFKNHAAMVGYAKTKKAPMPELTIPLTGAFLVIAGLSFLLGAYPLIGALCLVAFFVPVTFMMHDYWNVQDPQMKSAQRINFEKNMALLGSGLMFLAIQNPWPLSLGLHF